MMSGNYTSIDNQNRSGSVPAVPDQGHVTVKFQANDYAQTIMVFCVFFLGAYMEHNAQRNQKQPYRHFLHLKRREKFSGAAGPPPDADDTFTKPASGSEEPQQSGWFRTFSVATYKPYFDVDTSDVLERIKDSLFPFSGAFNEKTSNNPDFNVRVYIIC